MRRALTLAIAFTLFGCSAEGGTLKVTPSKGTNPGTELSDGVDLEGSGVDRGRGDDRPRRACAHDADCVTGVCTGSASKPGMCLTVCAAPAGTDLGGVAIEPCARGERCILVQSGIAFCLRPCASKSECPAIDGITIDCTVLSPLAGRWCGPLSSSASSD